MVVEEEEKQERGVEGGEARIKLYSKLKKIERRRFSVDVLARDRGEEPTKDPENDGREDDDKEEEESQNTFGSTRLPSEDDEDDDDTDLDREEAIVESDISGLQSVTEPNTRSETAEADRRAGKELLKEEEEEQNEEEDGDKEEAKNKELNVQERILEEKKAEEEMKESQEEKPDKETEQTSKEKEKVKKMKSQEFEAENEQKEKETQKKGRKVKKEEESKKKEPEKKDVQKEKSKKEMSSAIVQNLGKNQEGTEKETSRESADKNVDLDRSKTEDDLNEEKREGGVEDDGEERHQQEDDTSEQNPEEAVETNKEEYSNEKENDGDKESGFAISSEKDPEDESSTEATDVKNSKKEENAEEEGAKLEEEGEKPKTDDSDFDEENFSDDDSPLEGDLHLSDASINEDEIAVSNPDVLNHFGEKIVKSPETAEKKEAAIDDDEDEGPVLRAVTFADTVNEIVTRLNTKAVIEEGTKEEKPKEFAAFNWKPNVTFFQFGAEQEDNAAGSSSSEVFSFAGGPPAPPLPVKQRRGASLPRGSGGFGGGNVGRGWERLRRVSGRDRGRRRDRSV